MTEFVQVLHLFNVECLICFINTLLHIHAVTTVTPASSSVQPQYSSVGQMEVRALLRDVAAVVVAFSTHSFPASLAILTIDTSVTSQLL